jgi:hypothetical protein
LCQKGAKNKKIGFHDQWEVNLHIVPLPAKISACVLELVGMKSHMRGEKRGETRTGSFELQMERLDMPCIILATALGANFANELV